MLDLRHIRENPDFYDQGWARRGLEPQTPTLLSLDEKHRSIQTEMQNLQNRRNLLSREIGELKSKGGDASAQMAEVASLKDKLQALEQAERSASQDLNDKLSALPNIPHPSVPDGKDENDNVVVRNFGSIPILPVSRDHVDIGENLGGIDFETAAKISGARFVFLYGGVARLERALAQFMLDTHTTEHGYTELSVPLMVRDDALYATGQLPKFEEDLFKTQTGHSLIPTSEVPLTSSVMDSIQDAADLPLRYTALTPCFRSEAGAAGKDTRGMIRQHQFYKVELVSITTEDQSEQEHERMTACAENILKKLNLPYQTVALCAGDMGFSAVKTYDLEVWLPGQGRYREISSCSNCGDFQARRMKARYKSAQDKTTRYLHTLNGSGLAVGRTLVAVLENYQQEDGSVLIPDVLKPYMGGIEKLEPIAKTSKAKVANA